MVYQTRMYQQGSAIKKKKKDLVSLPTLSAGNKWAHSHLPERKDIRTQLEHNTPMEDICQFGGRVIQFCTFCKLVDEERLPDWTEYNCASWAKFGYFGLSRFRPTPLTPHTLLSETKRCGSWLRAALVLSMHPNRCYVLGRCDSSRRHGTKFNSNRWWDDKP